MLEVYDASVSVQGARLVNLSARAQVGTGDKMLIPGLVIGGSDPVRVLVRVVGPGLAGFGVTGALARPSMTLFSGQAQRLTNSGWSAGVQKADIAAAAASVGAFPLVEGSADCAALLTLQRGLHHPSFRSRQHDRRGVGGGLRRAVVPRSVLAQTSAAMRSALRLRQRATTRRHRASGESP